MAWTHIRNPLSIGALIALCAFSVRAEIDEDEIPLWRGEDSGAAWREGEVPEARYPVSADLIPLRDPAGMPSVRVYVDGRQLARGGDGVVRYVLLFRSRQGAETVFHEGMRCGARQWRRYAYGSHGRMRAAPTDWRPLGRGRRAALHRLLYEQVFCPAGVVPPDAADMRRRLRALAATVNDLTDE